MEWINIRDRLPKSEQQVLCCLVNGDMAIIEQAVYRPSGEASWRSVHDEDVVWRSDAFSHWMPLPEAAPQPRAANSRRT